MISVIIIEENSTKRPTRIPNGEHFPNYSVHVEHWLAIQSIHHCPSKAQKY